MDVRLGASATRVARDGAFAVTLDDGTNVEVDELLVAVGRTPGTSGIGLETLGLEAGKTLRVGDDLRVPGHDWLFAIGDVNGRALLTHMGKYQGRLAADAILGRAVKLRSDGGRSPRVIFTDPQVGAVGLTLAAAQEAGIRCVTSMSRPAATRAARSSATARAGRRGWWSTRTPRRRRRHDHGRRDRRGPARGDDRGRGRGLARRSLARRAVVPDAQRALAAPARGVRALSGGG